MRARNWLAQCVALVATVMTFGCAHYTTPGGPANFRALGIATTPAEVQASTDPSINERLSRKPLASFPVTVAAVRVQDRGYRSYSDDGWGGGDFTIVGVREAEKQEHLERLSKLPMLREFVPINRMVVTNRIKSEKDLRDAAANLQCEMIAIYTFDTRFGRQTTIPYLGVISLGLFPNEQATVTATASAALIDTRSGYVYGVYEATARKDRLSNAWGTQDAIDAARRDAEAQAFDKLVDEFDQGWRRMIQRYAPGAGQ